MVIRIGRDDPDKERRQRQGRMIRKLRELNELSIAEFADELGVSAGAVSQWETGRFAPRAKHQVAIARTLKVTPSAIFSLDAEVA